MTSTNQRLYGGRDVVVEHFETETSKDKLDEWKRQKALEVANNLSLGARGNCL